MKRLMDETAFLDGIRMNADGAQCPVACQWAVSSPCPRSGAFATTTTKTGKTTL